MRTQKFAEHQAVTPACGMISPGSDASHWLELFKMGSFKTLEKLILRMLFWWNDTQLFFSSQRKLNIIVVQVPHCLDSYFAPNKSTPIMPRGWFQSCTFNELSYIDSQFPGLFFSQVWVLIKKPNSTHFCWKIRKCYFSFLSFVYLLAKVPYVRKQCFVLEPLVRSFYEESKTVVSFWKWHFMQASLALWVPAFPVVSSCSGQLWQGVMTSFPFFRFCKLRQSCLCTGCHSVNERLSDWHEASESTAQAL